MKDRSRRRVVLALKIGVACSLIAWQIGSGRLDLSRLTAIPISADLVLLALLVFGSMALPVVRWWWLLRIQGLRHAAWKIAALTWASYVGAVFLPGAASGDLVKAFLIVRDNRQARARAFSTVLADRAIGLASLLVLGAAASFVLSVQGHAAAFAQTLLTTTLVLLGILLLCAAMLLVNGSRQVLLRLFPAAWRDAWNESFRLYLENTPGLVGCFLLSLVSSAMTIAALGIAGRLLGNAVDWGQVLLAGPLVAVANCLPITPGGIGIAEAVSSELFTGLGTSAGAEMMLLVRIVAALVSLPGILVFLVPQSVFQESQTIDAATEAGQPTRGGEPAADSSAIVGSAGVKAPGVLGQR